MAMWEYAELNMSDRGHHIYFTHSQGSGFVNQAKAYFVKGLKEGNSSSDHLELNFSHTTRAAATRFLADQGWEMVSAHYFSTGSQLGTEVNFKRARE